MAERLQDRIRRGARERAKQGARHNPTIERFEAERGRSPLRKKRRARPSRPARPRTSSSPEVGSLATALTKAALQERGSRGGARSGSESPVALMLEDMSKVLTTFRKSEGRDPNAQDSEFWTAYKKIMAARLAE